MSARTQTVPTGQFTPRSGTGTFIEVSKQINTAIESLVGDSTDGRLTFSIKRQPDGSFMASFGRVKSKSRATAKPGAAATDLDAAIAAARRRGDIRVAEILAGEDMASADTFAASLGITRQSLHAKLGKHHVIGLEGAKRGVKFPIWQIGADGKPFAALPALAAALDGPWAVYRFLTQYQPQLDMTGLEALQKGCEDDAIALARNLERSGA